METLLLVAGLAILVLVAAMVRGWTAAERDARHKAEKARRDADQTAETLDVTRRIQDATADPLPVDAARGWLRDFGGGAPPEQR